MSTFRAYILNTGGIPGLRKPEAAKPGAKKSSKPHRRSTSDAVVPTPAGPPAPAALAVADAEKRSADSVRSQDDYNVYSSFGSDKSHPNMRFMGGSVPNTPNAYAASLSGDSDADELSDDAPPPPPRVPMVASSDQDRAAIRTRLRERRKRRSVPCLLTGVTARAARADTHTHTRRRHRMGRGRNASSDDIRVEDGLVIQVAAHAGKGVAPRVMARAPRRPTTRTERRAGAACVHQAPCGGAGSRVLRPCAPR
jgi:hypothetical protein